MCKDTTVMLKIYEYLNIQNIQCERFREKMFMIRFDDFSVWLRTGSNPADIQILFEAVLES